MIKYTYDKFTVSAVWILSFGLATFLIIFKRFIIIDFASSMIRIEWEWPVMKAFTFEIRNSKRSMNYKISIVDYSI